MPRKFHVIKQAKAHENMDKLWNGRAYVETF